MVEVSFFDPMFEPEGKLMYSVITAKYLGRWVFVRHHKRKTFEIPGGHIGPDETSYDAARRELMEETGAIDFSMLCVSTYRVKTEKETGYGRLYFAEIFKLGDIPDRSEINEIIFMNKIPEQLTYPDIQPHLFKKVINYLSEKRLIRK
jgi:8-oxo-dGTP diphosphatase